MRLIVDDRIVARHPRDWARQNVHYDPLHYLALLERKPGSLDFARPLEDWQLPECFGVLRRRPESRWRRTPADVADLAGLQTRLLDSAIGAVRVGGVVGYATCSPHVAETDVVVGEALRRGDVERLDVRPLLPEVENLGDGPDLRLWPHVHDTDGMFLALLRRVR